MATQEIIDLAAQRLVSGNQERLNQVYCALLEDSRDQVVDISAARADDATKLTLVQNKTIAQPERLSR